MFTHVIQIYFQAKSTFSLCLIRLQYLQLIAIFKLTLSIAGKDAIDKID